MASLLYLKHTFALHALHAPEVECIALGLVPGRRPSSA
jgi:hypothetical protein